MTRVDFYILPDQSRDAAMRFACRLGLKALQSGQRVHVHTQDAEAAQALDDLMWDYPRHRFVPHSQTASAATVAAPVQIGWEQPNLDEGLLINLGQDVPKFFGRFDRVAEIVVADDRDAGRDRYKHYRDRGYPLHHHELDNWEN